MQKQKKIKKNVKLAQKNELAEQATEEMEQNDSSNDDDDDSEDENSSADPELAASSTTKSKHELLKEQLLAKYKELHGKQLFVRFASKLPADEKEFQHRVTALSPLIIKAHKPRQSYARFCLVDFASQEDRDATFKRIRKNAEKKKDPTFEGVSCNVPRTEDPNYVQELVQKKLQSLQKKKEKARLKKAAKHAERTKTFTSTIVILNLPENSTIADVRKLYPTAIDIQMRPPKGKQHHGPNVASITLPSSMEARVAIKKKVSIGETKLFVRFALQHKKKKNKNNKNSKQKEQKNLVKIQKPLATKNLDEQKSVKQAKSTEKKSAGQKLVKQAKTTEKRSEGQKSVKQKKLNGKKSVAVKPLKQKKLIQQKESVLKAVKQNPSMVKNPNPNPNSKKVPKALKQQKFIANQSETLTPAKKLHVKKTLKQIKPKK